VRMFWLENLKARDHSDLVVDGEVILEWMIGTGLSSFGSGEGSVVGCCEHGNEPSDSIKAGDILSS
jgi:hypothetical protein